jgi:4-aminobutyrate aminotransferase-like enzyme/Ser/Thr protein kinase RdoA (MazF antagonist)
MNFEKLKISVQQAESIAFTLFNIQGTASPLPGELDFNFRIKVKNSAGFILKISRPDEDEEYLDFQQQLLRYIEVNDKNLLAPKVVPDVNNKPISEIADDFGNSRMVRLLTWVSGRIWSQVNPQLDNLRYSLGEKCGFLSHSLQGFTHPKAQREFVWDIAQSLWTKEHIQLFDGEEKKIISHFQNRFEAGQNTYSGLRKSVVHNDANDNNVIVSAELINPSVMAAIDYGDAIHTQIINDVAIACAYAIMSHADPLAASLPLVQGYNSTFKLEEEELRHLYIAIAMRLVISVTKSAINKIAEPDNQYLLISEGPAWEVLKKWHLVDEEFALASFRKCCNLNTHPNEEAFLKWASKNNFKLAELFPTINLNTAHNLDLSVASTWLGQTHEIDYFQFKIGALQKQFPEQIIAGGYLEPRAVYTTSKYDKIGNSGSESRTIHLGVDFWLPAATPVHALLNGEVVTAVNDEGDKEYGGLIILKHSVADFEFYSLYGHLSIASIEQYNTGEQINKGDCLGYLGNYPENGNWAPHLHFQIMLSLLEYKDDFPGVAYYNQIDVWQGLCPNPNLLFQLKELDVADLSKDDDLLSYRKQHLGKGLSLHYENPIHIVHGASQYLLDQNGRKYLDTVNNVAHVGHEHPAVVKAGQDQMAVLNTNTRYIHPNIKEFAQELLKTLPAELSVLHFVNSGSEANELAIRMVKANTGECDIIASEMGYHGNSNMCVDISSYKFDSPAGSGAPEHTHIFPLPAPFRGKYRGDDTGEKYAQEVQELIEVIKSKGRGIGAFIIEPVISCGGQVELPDGFLAKAYEYVRAAGGLCISDEVQVGCGRLGKVFWGFQLHNVIPDIITIGKPIGNGHPLAAVACTQEVAEKFANGIEYFNTFGGNPVSCAIGTEVLRTIKRENLQGNALSTGDFLKSELHKLSAEFPIIGDVRGQGLFLGIELVDTEMRPLAKQTDYLANRMKDHGILMSTDGPDHNVLKIKPPLVFSEENARELIFYLRKIFAEDFMVA